VKRLAAEQARDPSAGATLAARIDRELVNRAPWVPLFTPRFVDFVSSRVGNYQPNIYASSSVLLDNSGFIDFDSGRKSTWFCGVPLPR